MTLKLVPKAKTDKQLEEERLRENLKNPRFVAAYLTAAVQEYGKGKIKKADFKKTLKMIMEEI